MHVHAPPAVADAPGSGSNRLTRYAWLSIAAALVTIGLKTVAYLVTGSVGLLSDAAESGVNLLAAIVALVALTVAERPADANHHYGHGKAEYFSAGAEGLMIFLAAAVILVTAVQRLLHPGALDSVGPGLAVSTLASVVNGAVAVVLLRAGRTYRSATLVADGRHLLTDVWTSAGVLVGVLLVAVTGWQRLDAIVAAAVGLNILVTGGRLVWGSVNALLDPPLPVDDLARLDAVLARCCEGEVGFSDVRTRESGRHRFVSVTITVPGDWSVDRAHALSHEVADAVTAELPGTEVHTHLAPR